MLEDLREIQKQSGVILTENQLMIESFHNDSQGFKLAYNGAVICDRTHWGLLQLTGEDRLRFLHNQTTNNINALKPGQGCYTVFVNSTGRTLDLATAYVTDEAILLLVSPNRRQFLLEWMDRYIFPMDKVQISDISQQNAIFTLMGSETNKLLTQGGMNISNLVELPPENHTLVTIKNEFITVANGSGLAIPGYTLIVPINQAKIVWEELIKLGITPIGDRVWEQLRIKQGRPFPDKELTEDYIALEAGLWQAISFDKGCYIGQETIARLNTYKGVKQRLWGVKLTQLVDPGTPVILDGNKIGILTSCIEIEQEFWGLAYVKTKAGGAGLTVIIGEATGELIAVPFVTHEYYQPSGV
ncbi:folate-binding protein YgfZ [Rippkaea orientalis PCC 8801]|uniref:Folate-binding protein YgfZ n=1 Tax=Rippkaea orientalis (strain PCC 8801 / RF-1) TaxID=41431 RepID=B7K0L6_RIPO1|nr:folate-binding protein YgfZ [Rippkaea orientalis]ACK64170.1 folate-binding protein YgfZ [Rippkaea orientalis PCC 8801]